MRKYAIKLPYTPIAQRFEKRFWRRSGIVLRESYDKIVKQFFHNHISVENYCNMCNEHVR